MEDRTKEKKTKYLIHYLDKNSGVPLCLILFIMVFQFFLATVLCYICLKYSNYQQRMFESEIKSFIRSFYDSNISENKEYIKNNLTQAFSKAYEMEDVREKRQNAVVV